MHTLMHAITITLLTLVLWALRKMRGRELERDRRWDGDQEGDVDYIPNRGSEGIGRLASREEERP